MMNSSSNVVDRLARLVAIALFLLWLVEAGRIAAAQLEAPTSRRPNVVLIITDDQGYGDLSCHGNPVLRTPHLDQLFRHSVRLTDFHVDPTCSPTRAALMTGRYSTRAGVWHTVMGRHMPRRDEIMMPHVFAESGYRTAIFGKWHLGDSYPFRPQDRGFHEVLIHGGGGVGQIPDYWGNDYFDDTYFRYCDRTLLPAGPSGGKDTRPASFKLEESNGYCTDVFFREAANFITAHREQPFFVYLSTNAPHSPYRVADGYSRAYEDKVGGDKDLARFYGMIANIDENVGRLLAKLDELALADDTILIFMTDNGTARGATFTDYRGNEGRMQSGYNAGMRGRKGSPYDGGHRVPCFFRWPAGGLTGGRDVDRLTVHLDLLPTLIELCQLKRPAGIELDGTSLGPLLAGHTESWPQRTLFAHHQELPRPEKYRFGCVMTRRWRLILRDDLTPAPQFELYDVAADPGQTSDLSQRHPDVVLRLQAAYDDWWEDLAPRFDEYSYIIVGDDRQNPTRLSCFEWHSSQHWGQNSVRKGSADNGFWAIDVARPGTYEITLRRWPPEVDAPITAAVDGGKAIEAVQAKVRIGRQETTQPIPEGASAVRFCVHLQPGKARLETWLIGGGQSRGAYYATVKRADP